MQTPEELRDFLAAQDAFRDLPGRLVSLIADRLTEQSFPAGTVLVRRGERGDRLLVIQEGCVRVSVPEESGSYPIATVGPGGVIGEMALLTHRNRNADVTALADTRALALSVADFEELARENHELAVVLTNLLADRLGQARLDGLRRAELEGYRVDYCLGRGGMAIVYKAHETGTGREVALKMMSHRLVYDSNALRRFQREADVAESFQHENITRIYGRFEAYKTFFLVMELCEGPTLADLVRSVGPLPESEVRAALGQVACALAHVHAQGVMHRDIKPSNVLAEPTGRLKLTDFGLARPELFSDITQVGMLVGTPAFMAPEQLSGGEPDERVDLYALGCTAYELLTGRRLFDATALGPLITSKLNFTLPPAEVVRPGLSEDLYDVLRTSLAQDPAQRTVDLHAVAGWAAPMDPALLKRATASPPDPDAPTATDPL